MSDAPVNLTPAPNEPSARTATARIRPKDAAALILVDRSTPAPRVLMGRRSSGHVFMPDVYVFPGGRRDPGDHALPFSNNLHPLVLEKLLAATSARMTDRRAHALALAALREVHEETGIVPAGGPADLSRLRYIARAITPPGNVRRYDTHFFLAFCDETVFDLTQLRDTDELEDLQWLDIAAISGVKLARITQMVLEDVKRLMEADRDLPFENSVSFYSMRHGRFVRSRL
ncbi:NUDIX domain-containing protein [Rhizobiales bacterium RZME27]|uniref:NUDIX domain-containing protein n=1 Tax=Endobacterium cereale TaxID=2663029 RepID=A0A6A8AGD5_9HYPH|nr:NUDIX hydrolase [Endobacterium cereale]MEB2846075.1 NUDIX hydrolase [Endobacterium cereale]MQY48286.1 NUDIX domain-containing protein [Endobacterium cereale]